MSVTYELKDPLAGAGIVRDTARSDQRSAGGRYDRADRIWPSLSLPAFSAPESEHVLAGDLRACALALGKAGTSLILEEARVLAWLQDHDGREDLGFSSFADLAREALQMAPRTAQEHVALHRLCEGAPPVRSALLEGALSPCQALALRPVFRDGTAPVLQSEAAALPDDSGDDGLLEQLRAWGRRPVSALRLMVRQALQTRAGSHGGGAANTDVDDRNDDDPAEPVFHTLTFGAPPAAAMAMEQAIELARKVLGYDAPRYQCLETILIEAVPEALGAADDEEAAEAAVEEAVKAAVEEAPEAAVEEALEAASEVNDNRPVDELRNERKATLRAIAVSTARPRDPADRGPFQLDQQRARDRACQTVTQVRRHLRDLDDLIDAGDPASARDAVQRIRQLQLLGRPCRALLGRILRDLRDTRSLTRLRHTEIEELCTKELGLSERSARALRREADLFEDCPELEAAFCEGTLGLSQAVRIGRFAAVPAWARASPRRGLGKLELWIRRASQVTSRQFDRECRFLERLHAYWPSLGVEAPGALLGRGLESVLLSRLREITSPEGPIWPPARVEAYLEKRGLGEREAMASIVLYKGRRRVSRDPAHNPVILRRLETMLDLLTTAAVEAGLAAGCASGAEGAARGGCATVADVQREERKAAARQTFARPNGDGSWVGNCGCEDTCSCDDAGGRDHQPAEPRQTFARPCPPADQIRIRISLPETVHQHWQAAIAYVRRECVASPDIELPVWAAATLILDKAMREWGHTDPETIPVGRKILERDEYRCRVPGCTRRHGLEIHHILWRSRGGTDQAWNLICVCALHHRMVHLGLIRVYGKAPGNLHWEMGRRVIGEQEGSAGNNTATSRVPTNRVPTNRVATSRVPTNGVATNGVPTNGVPTNGATTNSPAGPIHESILRFLGERRER